MKIVEVRNVIGGSTELATTWIDLKLELLGESYSGCCHPLIGEDVEVCKSIICSNCISYRDGQGLPRGARGLPGARKVSSSLHHESGDPKSNVLKADTTPDRLRT